MLWLVQMLLILVAMLWLVPLLTSNQVHVRGGLFRATLALIGVSFLEVVLWVGLTVVTLFTDLILNALTLGLFGLLVRGFAYLMVGRLAPGILHVRDYWSAFGAALVMTVASWGIMHFVH